MLLHQLHPNDSIQIEMYYGEDAAFCDVCEKWHFSSDMSSDKKLRRKLHAQGICKECAHTEKYCRFEPIPGLLWRNRYPITEMIWEGNRWTMNVQRKSFSKWEVLKEGDIE